MLKRGGIFELMRRLIDLVRQRFATRGDGAEHRPGPSTGRAAEPVPLEDEGKTWELLDIRGMVGRTDNLWRYELVKMAERLGTNPSFHAAVMAIESGFKPDARNPVSNASGLIQFMPFLLKKWGLSPAGVRSLSALDQLELVERYYRPHRAKMHSVCDHYLATFMPAHLGKPESFVLAEKGSKAYEQNAAFDREKKGYYTIGDVCVPVRARVAEAEKKPRIIVTPEARPPKRGGGGGGLLAVFGVGAAAVAVALAKARGGA